MTTKTATTGRIFWHELVTGDVQRAVGFYGELFGWRSRAMDMGPGGTYTLLSIGDVDVGGIAPANPGQTHPHWLGYISTPDVDATAKLAKSLGATIAVPPTDIPNIGRFTLLLDPQGAPIAPMTALEEKAEVDKPAVGTFCWDELLSSDQDASVAFHTKLFGFQTKAMDMGPMGTYQVLAQGEKQRGGVMKAPPGVPTHWLAYVVVDDVDASAARAKKLGARIVAEASDIPGIGRFAVITDPTGASVALFKGAQ